MSGFFISFEGGEGSGKTSAIQYVEQNLSQLKIPFISTREPGGSKLGKHIRSILLEQEEYFLSSRAELFLFLADRANHIQEVIQPALTDGKVVLCDRFSDSTIAYQSIHNEFTVAEMEPIIQFATGGLTPALTFYLDIDPVIGLERAKRISFDRMEKKALQFHQKVRENFLEIAQKNPTRVVVIDANQPMEMVHQTVYSHIEKRLM